MDLEMALFERFRVHPAPEHDSTLDVGGREEDDGRCRSVESLVVRGGRAHPCEAPLSPESSPPLHLPTVSPI